MSKRDLPALPVSRPAGRIQTDVMPRAMERWNPGIRAAVAEEDRSISILDVIGIDWWTGEGVTSKRIAAALRSLGPGPVTVNINSPGGDLFEGLGIYNLLREHDGEVTVKVLGLAASAASIIAMAGDTIQIARAGFFMVHNGWVIAVGNRHDLRDVADWIEPFDAAMADVYAARTGGTVEEMAKLMDGETWMGGSAAIERGFADEFLPSDQVERSSEAKAAASILRQMELALRRSGMPKSEALRLISELKSSVGDPAGSGGGDPAGRARVDPAQAKRLYRNLESLSAITLE